ncbi:MAG: polymer-forming cytoskeletal protein [Angelakisella sp.]
MSAEQWKGRSPATAWRCPPAPSSVIQDADSTLVGDIISANLTAAGKVVGNVTVDNCISLKSTAVILGNLSFRDLAVEQGAVLRGEIKTNRAEME